MDLPKINLHTHSVFSDGRPTIKQIVKRASEIGLEYLAITDHSTNSWKASMINGLNTPEKINFFFEKIEKAKNYLEKRGLPLKVLKGIEIDLTSTEKFIKLVIKPDQFDIILFEYIETPDSIAYVKNLMEFWRRNYTSEELPIFGVAHCNPDYFLVGSLDMFINFLSEYNICFEFNSAYSEVYSRKNELFFEKLKGTNIAISVGTDSHSVRRLGDIEEALDMISYYGLESNYQLIIQQLKEKFP